MEMTEDNDIQTIQMKAELDRGEVILQKQDICLSDVEDKRVAGLNDFSSLKECKCCLGGGGFCDLVIHAVGITTSQDANINCSMFHCIETWWPTSIQRLWPLRHDDASI
ncbi:uncharacterized protein LOC114267493 isoform X1 [Camellia sinensis]|uniref:uncharacterized protein LOC114267493 isoform X1 n=1 Tax=Camellia sinensis TaxID=4442 RepID=UPI0010358E22|nr:uncharacterized protein LOC114267493 isoform X1 [Camellia sinensis]